MALVLLEGEIKSTQPDVLTITDRQVQQTGIRFGLAKKRDLLKTIDSYGEITYDEHRLFRITSWVEGRIEKMHISFTGEKVTKGKILVELYSPSLISSIDQFREAKRSLIEAKKSSNNADFIDRAKELESASRIILIRQGLTLEQVKKIESDIDKKKDVFAKKTIPNISIFANSSGVVVKKMVEEGAYVKQGTEMFRIADLSILWLYSDIYEYELPFVEKGNQVTVTTRSYPGEEFTGTIEFIDPIVQRQTRTIRVRINIPNSDRKLKPGMFAKVQIQKKISSVLSVPESSVLHSGLRKIVFVHEGKGRFRPKLVKLKLMWLYPAKQNQRENALDFALDEKERYHQVSMGLKENEEVVVAGNFLLNAEAQFQGLLKKTLEVKQEKTEVKLQFCDWDGQKKSISKMVAISKGAEQLYFCTDSHKSSYHSHPKKSWKSYLQQYHIAMNQLLEHYYKLGNFLANDKPHFAEFIAIAKATFAKPEAHFEKNSLNILQKTFQKIRQIARRGQNTTELIPQRRIYGELSKEFIEHINRHKANGEVYLYKCGMAGSMHKIPTEIWIQNTKKIRNPYMGLSMFT